MVGKSVWVCVRKELFEISEKTSSDLRWLNHLWNPRMGEGVNHIPKFISKKGQGDRQSRCQ